MCRSLFVSAALFGGHLTQSERNVTVSTADDYAQIGVADGKAAPSAVQEG